MKVEEDFKNKENDSTVEKSIPSIDIDRSV